MSEMMTKNHLAHRHAVTTSTLAEGRHIPTKRAEFDENRRKNEAEAARRAHIRRTSRDLGLCRPIFDLPGQAIIDGEVS
jgi:hypothetical protein